MGSVDYSFRAFFVFVGCDGGVVSLTGGGSAGSGGRERCWFVKLVGLVVGVLVVEGDHEC